MNHHEVVNLVVDLPEEGPMRKSIHSILKACFFPLRYKPTGMPNESKLDDKAVLYMDML